MVKHTEQLLQNIKNYVSSYNDFNVEGMMKDLHEGIIFKNISNGKVNLTTNGKTAFKDQAKQFFKTRKQTINETIIDNKFIEIGINYRGIIAVNLPNGLKEGDKIELHGKSIFKFIDNKIIEIVDIS